jgi:surface antigen
MKRTALLAGLFVCAGIFSAHSPKVGAQAPSVVFENNTSSVADSLAVLELVEQQSIKQEQAASRPPEPVKHVIEDGETLVSVAIKHKTTWQRLYYKNVQVSHPDVINPGETLIVPSADEQLAERALPEPPVAARTEPKRSSAPWYTQSRMSRGSSAGNTYTYGYCTWYAKNKRPDLPNNLGNADTWVSRAAAQGIPTGSAPRVGAIGQRGMHVVYVERVNADGTVYISEMNREGWNVVSTRTVPGSYFHYIY